MADGALFTSHDIPFCPNTATELPRSIITWEEAKLIYNNTYKKNESFLYDAFVCFYIDDYKFDGPNGIWHNSKQLLNVLSHFSGAITPDFSTYQDFPEPLKIYATYRMRLLGYWLGKNAIQVINNVRWGTPETWDYCFSGIPCNSIVAIGTVGGSPRKHIDRQRFYDGLNQLVKRIKPHTIIVYGSAKYDCFKNLEKNGIKVISFKSKTSKAFEGRITDE